MGDIEELLNKLDASLALNRPEKDIIEEFSHIKGVGWKYLLLEQLDDLIDRNEEEENVVSMLVTLNPQVFPERFAQDEDMLVNYAADAVNASRSEMPNQSEMIRQDLFKTYRGYMTQLWEYLVSEKIRFGRNIGDSMYCPNDPFSDKFDPKVTSLQSQIIPKMLNPATAASSNGMLLYHEVGTGKTRLALSILKQYSDAGYRIIWVTTKKAESSVQNQLSDLKVFDPKTTKQNSPMFLATSATSHKKGKIALFNFEKFINSVRAFSESVSGVYDKEKIPSEKGAENAYGRTVLTERYKEFKGYRDPFAKTVIVLDEAHKIFDGGPNGNVVYDMIARHSYKTMADAKGKKDATMKCKWLLLTATPVPEIDIPKKTTAKVSASNTYSLFKLLNILIDDNVSELLPTTDQDFEGYKGEQFASQAKGLVSFLRPDWSHIFAESVREDDVVINPSEAQQKRIKQKLNDSTCKTYKRNPTLLARCYLRYLNWFGPTAQPKFSDDKAKTVGSPDTPWGIESTKAKPVDQLNFPRGQALLEKIRTLDAADRAKNGGKGPLYKHVIYSSSREAPAAFAYWLTKDGEFDYLEPKERYTINDKFRDLETNEPLRIAKKDNKNNVLFFMHDELRDTKIHPDSQEVQGVFNGENFSWDKDAKTPVRDPKINAHGDLARIMVLGSGRKEALSLFEVKYVHIMEPQKGDSDTVQIIGRAIRRCGHVGLKPDERKVHVYMYGLDVGSDDKNIIAFKAPNRIFLGDIVYAVLKQDKDLGKRLVTREKMIGWLETTSIEQIDHATKPELEAGLDEVHRKLKEIDNRAFNEQNEVIENVNILDDMSVAELRKRINLLWKALGITKQADKVSLTKLKAPQLKELYTKYLLQFRARFPSEPEPEPALCGNKINIGQDIPQDIDLVKCGEPKVSKKDCPCTLTDLKQMCKAQNIVIGPKPSRKSLTDKCLVGIGNREPPQENPFVEGYVKPVKPVKPVKRAKTVRFQSVSPDAPTKISPRPTAPSGEELGLSESEMRGDDEKPKKKKTTKTMKKTPVKKTTPESSDGPTRILPQPPSPTFVPPAAFLPPAAFVPPAASPTKYFVPPAASPTFVPPAASPTKYFVPPAAYIEEEEGKKKMPPKTEVDRLREFERIRKEASPRRARLLRDQLIQRDDRLKGLKARQIGIRPSTLQGFQAMRQAGTAGGGKLPPFL